MQPYKDPENFKPGIYKHYKREGNYIALALVSHHDTDELFVVYVCGETGRTRIREWASSDKDSWSDMVGYDTTEMKDVPRFKYIGPST